jgi:hypothetical protein
MKNKKRTILILVLLIFLVIRFIVPVIIHSYAERELNKLHPNLRASIDDVELSILRPSVEFKDLKFFESQSEESFMNIGLMKSSFEITEMSKRIFSVKIILYDFELAASKKQIQLAKDVVAYLKKKSQQKKEKDKDKPDTKLITIGDSSFELINGTIQLLDFEGIKSDENLIINNISLTINNLNPDKTKPITTLRMKASIHDEGDLKTFAKINSIDKPISWEVDSSLTSFSLPSINALLKDKVPITFSKGELELYSEALSENGRIKGYVKPYLKGLDIVKNNEKFLGPKHWGIEVLSAITNLIMRNPDTKSMATRIPFEFDKKLKIDTGEALDKALENTFKQKLKPELENSLQLK